MNKIKWGQLTKIHEFEKRDISQNNFDSEYWKAIWRVSMEL